MKLLARIHIKHEIETVSGTVSGTVSEWNWHLYSILESPESSTLNACHHGYIGDIFYLLSIGASYHFLKILNSFPASDIEMLIDHHPYLKNYIAQMRNITDIIYPSSDLIQLLSKYGCSYQTVDIYYVLYQINQLFCNRADARECALIMCDSICDPENIPRLIIDITARNTIDDNKIIDKLKKYK